MANALTAFTSYDEIRAVLGVSDEELENVTLALPLYLRQLQLQLAGVSSGLESLYDTISAMPETGRTPQQARLYNVMQVFSAYAISKILLTSLSLFAPKRITDGRAEFERVADPFKDLRDEVNSYYDDLLGLLTEAAGDLGLPVGTRVNPRVYTVAAGLSVNPVTGA